MATVLLVEDEDSLRETLRRYLVHEGHEVVAAASGGEALEAGIGFNPDVLVADWMLKNHIHGLHVSQIFRALHPRLNTILITGFPSRDLLEESGRSGVMRLLEKPFDLTELQRAVRDAALLGATASPPASESEDDALSVYQNAPVAAIAVNAAGGIEFVSERARELFAESPLGRDPETLQELLGPTGVERVIEAEGAWIPLGADGTGDATSLLGGWIRARLRDGGAGWIIVMVPPDEEQRRSDPRIRILLDDRTPGSIRVLADPGPVVVIERDSVVRRLLVSQIERSGALCYPSDDFRSALRLLVAEPRVQTVLVDCGLAGAELASWATQIRAARPEATIVGTGSGGAEAAIREAGVEKVLRKPWRIQDLLDAIDS